MIYGETKSQKNTNDAIIYFSPATLCRNYYGDQKLPSSSLGMDSGRSRLILGDDFEITLHYKQYQ